MLAVRRILHPTDFSDCARRAQEQAVALARRFDAELHVLHVLVLPTADAGDPGRYLPPPVALYEEPGRRVEPALARLTREARAAGVQVVTAHRSDRFAGPAILEYAAENGVDLVVMGTHGRRGPARLLVGSVATEVLRLAACPVLTLRIDAAPVDLARPRTLLVPVDLDASDTAALSWATALAGRSGSKLEMLHVVDELVWSDVYGFSGYRDLLEQRGTVERESHAKLRAMLPMAAAGSDLAVSTHVRVGRPAVEIARLAGQTHADLVVMSTHGRTGVRRLFFGSVAEELVRCAPCPLLAIKAAAPVAVVEERRAIVATP